MKHARPDYDRIQDPSRRVSADKPVILLRAQDRYTAAVPRFFVDQVKSEGGDPEIVAAIRWHIPLIEAWQPKKSFDMLN